ncbi:MAG: hypothetical protein JWL80_260 [Parcubacteria group bacterium]|nr:hypothetical protein [Parcubacteria group bacterium]
MRIGGVARAVEGTTLEKWNLGNWIVSSNLTSSAKNFTAQCSSDFYYQNKN